MDQETQKKVYDFFAQFKFQKYRKGELLIRADDEPAGIFYIVKGSVKEYAISPKGDELVLNIFKPPAFFPMSWAMNNTPNNYFFEAIAECEIWRAPKDSVIIFLKKNPDVLYDLLRRVYKGTDGLLLRMVYLMTGSAYARLIAELLIYTKRFGKKGMDGKLVLDVTETDLATFAGMTRETVSREMKILKEKDLVSLEDNKIKIHDLEKLQEQIQ